MKRPPDTRLPSFVLLLLSATVLAADPVNEARRQAREAAEASNDASVVARAADLEDRFGSSGARYYRKLAEILSADPSATARRKAALERGWMVAARDEDTESEAWFQRQLAGPAAGPLRTPPSGAWIPGGCAALMFAAMGSPPRSPQTCLEEFSRTVRGHAFHSDPRVNQQYLRRLEEYFERLEDLKVHGQHAGEKTVLVLSGANTAVTKASDRIVALLGWQLQRRGGRTFAAAATKGERARRQEMASALGIDEIAMQEALQAGKEFVIDFRDEWVDLILEENQWRELYANANLSGGLTHAMVREPRIAILYLALAGMNRASARNLVRTVGLKPLLEKHAQNLALYSSSLQLEADRVATPGGERAEAVWARMAGASPRDPARFLRALLEKDEGRLLRFYYSLAQLDSARQSFFTRYPARTERLYAVFSNTREIEGVSEHVPGRSSVYDFLREIPLDPEGRLLFPGGPAAWMASRTRPGAAGGSAGRRRPSRVSTAEVEDEVFFRLTQSDYRAANANRAESENFLAVARIEAIRAEPLGETSAIALAENFAGNEGLYGYFPQLQGLGEEHWNAVFALAKKLRGVGTLEVNPILGQFHGAAHLLTIAEGQGLLQPEKSASLFGDLCRRFQEAASPGDYGRASLEWLRVFLNLVEPRWEQTGAGIALRGIVTGSDSRAADFDKVLELQGVPSAESLFRIQDSLAVIAGAGAPREATGQLAAAVTLIPFADLPRSARLEKMARENLTSYSKRPLAEALARLRGESARNRPDAAQRQALVREFWDRLSPQVTLLLAGLAYAGYLRPEDLLVAEDRLLLRKHQFLLLAAARGTTFPDCDLMIESDKTGSYALGGFSDFARVAGKLAMVGMPNLDANAQSVAAAEFGTLRATGWSRIGDEEVRLAGLRIRAAKEWIVESAARPRLYQMLADSAFGLLSVSRRAVLLDSVQRRLFDRAWRALSLSDLCLLSGRLLARQAQQEWSSPVIEELLKVMARPQPPQLDALGPSLGLLRRYMIPRLMELPPYEECARSMFPESLAQRTAELKLSLAKLYADHGWDAASLGGVAETVARAHLSSLKMADIKDWRAVVDHHRALRPRQVEEALARQ